MDEMLDEVCRATSEVIGVEITPEMAKGRSRKREIVIARAMFCYILRKHTSATLEAIARRIDKHHATVVHHVSLLESARGKEKSQRDLIIEVIGPRLIKQIERNREISLLVGSARAREVAKTMWKFKKYQHEKREKLIKDLLAAVRKNACIANSCPGYIREGLKNDLQSVLKRGVVLD